MRKAVQAIIRRRGATNMRKAIEGCFRNKCTAEASMHAAHFLMQQGILQALRS